ncbi:MAG TPA: tRNA-dihydrouridine synthase [Candidatus Thermoplasmatota archaeon]|nr:tRNA-dihydrouridine synthase [Candidatus Thermoplasmatota archaeon]
MNFKHLHYFWAAAKAGGVVRAARKAADEAGIRHVSAKMRLGPDESRLTYGDVGKAVEDAGASWVTLHARTVEQGYAGDARWEHIAHLVRALGIPVVGNGDLREPEDVLRMRDETACAGYFIARAAMRDPTVFARMRAALDGRDPGAGPDLQARLGLALRYLERAQQAGEARIALLRRQVLRFVAGAPGAKRLRVVLQEPGTPEALRAAVQREQQQLVPA